MMNTQEILDRLRRNAEDIRQRFSVKAMSLFGSTARDQAVGDSDIDVLVAFDGKATLDGFMDLKFYLEDLLDAKVDLVTDKALRPQIQRAIEKELIRVA